MITATELLEQRHISGSRDDGHTLALSIEGGGMRGALSAGMSAELEEQGLVGLFDAVYGTSVGALSGAYLVTGQARLNVEFFADVARQGKLFRSRPHLTKGLMDLDWLFDIGVDSMHPLDYEAVLNAAPSLHPLLTKAGWHRAADAQSRYSPDAQMLRSILKGACRLPIAAGLPIGEFRGGFWDAAQHEAWPMRSPLEAGVSRLVILRSTPEELSSRHGGSSFRKALAGAAGVAGGLITGSVGAVRYHAQAEQARQLEQAGLVFQIMPQRQIVSSDERSAEKVIEAIEHGRFVARKALIDPH